MAAKPLTLAPASREALEAELGKNLASGGCFVAGATGFEANETCELSIVHPESGQCLTLTARVVWVSAAPVGVGVAFEGFGPAMREQIRAFVDAPAAPIEEEPVEDAATAETVHQRMRNLNVNEQLRIAREGDANERMVLERIYGKAVWAALLANPRLTPPEVARIARMGNLPLPELERIAGNAAWLSSPQVRRALLANARLPLDAARRILSAMPKQELKLVPTQTAYSGPVRAEAKRMLDR
jgi:hypothetical protein